MNGISALIKVPREHASSLQCKVSYLHSRSRLLPEPGPAGTLILDFQSQNYEKSLSVYKPPGLWYSVTATQTDEDNWLAIWKNTKLDSSSIPNQIPCILKT